MTEETTLDNSVEPATETTVGEVAGSFHDSLPDDLKGEKSLADFKDIASLAKSYVHQSKLVGSSIRIPTEDAGEETLSDFYSKLESVPGVIRIPEGEEDKERFYRKLGKPESATEYKINIPEESSISEDQLRATAEFAHQCNFTQDQFNTLVAAEIAKDAEMREKSQALGKSHEESVRKMWGETFETKAKSAELAIKQYEEKYPEQMKELQASGLHTNPVVLSLLADAGSKLAESSSTFVKGQHSGGLTPDEAKQQIDEIRMNSAHAYHNSNDPGHEAAVAKVQRLYQALTSRG